ncbi:MAG: Eco57I restriction-modification methylase domain-containing protein [Bacteroidaceae bacterium]|nr:Eco57I restriction-modification methylase domain-containing protein [Bacteroidaceae bacterium]
MNKLNYNPDVLSCLANLSNDEVFTPPSLANQMLDMLPQELFRSSETKFLDPCTKSGVFLREIAKRLIEGLADKIPNLQERIDHIMHHQLYGIAITRLTSLMSRRSLYCSKDANCKYSISLFDDADGNIRFKDIRHTWQNGKCSYCGASQEVYDRSSYFESHAYEFIHTDKPNTLYNNMTFDVIIGNPPYQLSDGGAQASAIPIYNKFVTQAIKLMPKYLTMIIPSRWMTGGRGLDDFRKDLLADNRFSVIHDFKDASLCFTGVEIKGGVNYFLWERDKTSPLCLIINDYGSDVVKKSKRPLIEQGCDVFIRNNDLIPIFRKVSSKKEKSFSSIVSSMKPYGLRGDFFKSPDKYGLPAISKSPIKDGYVIYGLDERMKRCCRYISNKYPLPKKDDLNKFKLFMSRNQGEGILGEIFVTPVFAKPNELCTETFVVVGGFDSEQEMYNCWSYMKTKFFRTMLGMKKNDQGCGQSVYQFVPLQDFCKPWTDEELYKKYGLTEEEIQFIESMIRPME